MIHVQRLSLGEADSRVVELDRASVVDEVEILKVEIVCHSHNFWFVQVNQRSELWSGAPSLHLGKQLLDDEFFLGVGFGVVATNSGLERVNLGWDPGPFDFVFLAQAGDALDDRTSLSQKIGGRSNIIYILVLDSVKFVVSRHDGFGLLLRLDFTRLRHRSLLWAQSHGWHHILSLCCFLHRGW